MKTYLRHCIARGATVSLFAASFCAAGGPAGGTGNSAGGSTGRNLAPNQGAFLDDVSRDASNELPARPNHPGIEATSPSPIGRGEGPASRSLVIPRVLRRRPTTAGLRDPTEPSNDQAAPWYRTGFGALAIVLLLVGGVTWVFKRWVPVTRSSGGGVLRIVARAGISPKQSVALVHVGNRFVLIGVCGDRVSSLCEISDPGEVARLAVRTGASVKRDAPGFDDLLSREESDYHEADAPAAEAHRPAHARGARTREPWKDLLRKLRALQTQ